MSDAAMPVPALMLFSQNQRLTAKMTDTPSTTISTWRSRGLLSVGKTFGSETYYRFPDMVVIAVARHMVIDCNVGAETACKIAFSLYDQIESLALHEQPEKWHQFAVAAISDDKLSVRGYLKNIDRGFAAEQQRGRKALVAAIAIDVGEIARGVYARLRAGPGFASA